MQDALNIQDIIEDTYHKYRTADHGEVAAYIPELAKADPNDFAICLATVDGQVFCAGDWDKEFTMPVCKPFAYQVALEELGRERTLSHVGVEPSGEAFNSIELDPKTMRPFNPMVNAGAIAIASLIKKESTASGVRNFVEKMELAAGRKLKIDLAVIRGRFRPEWTSPQAHPTPGQPRRRRRSWWRMATGQCASLPSMSKPPLPPRGRTLIVMERSEVKDDLVQDRIEVLSSFGARLYERRSAGNKTEKQCRPSGGKTIP